jgi:hypothetical protein
VTSSVNPNTGSAVSVRRLVFISHATPHDNEVTLWLATRLAAAGYEVWSDLTKLIGGEFFWRDIEDAIRNHAAKFISLVSRAAVIKSGFLDELSIAIAEERRGNLGDFVIPCRVDDFDFAKLPAQMHRKNVIDFSGGWHLGLAKLLEKFALDNVPRRQSGTTDYLSQWSKQFLAFDANLQHSEETLASNWLPVSVWPTHVRIALRDSEGPLARDAFPWPVAPTVGRGLASFALARELTSNTSTTPRFLRETSLDAFMGLDDMARGGLARDHTRRIVVDLVRQAWERFCKSRGLVAATLSSGRLCWYWPLPESSLAATSYVDLDGATRKKQLVGRSEKRKVYWHYAVEAFTVFGDRPRLVLVSHVVFTEDGNTPLESAARAHQLRRSFCKNWWQWQWRELLFAFLARLGSGDHLLLPVASDAKITVSFHPSRFLAPVSSAIVASPEEDMEEPLPSDEQPDEDFDDDDGSPTEEYEADE